MKTQDEIQILRATLARLRPSLAQLSRDLAFQLFIYYCLGTIYIYYIKASEALKTWLHQLLISLVPLR